jgi:UDP-N-acetylglucosamine 2-epimerase (non-hydrolysing)
MASVKIVSIVGARPNFMKIAPIIRALRSRSDLALSRGGAQIEHLLVHTGQHYDREMSGLFFEQLGIPAPDVNLGVGSGSHAVQTAEIMVRFEKICLEKRPTHVLVVGDVNSTIACALVAAKLEIPIAHVEAGLRSFDRRMPEEVNRVLTDAISDYLFTTEESANENLKREGVSAEKIHFVGNAMIDTLLAHKQKADASTILERLNLGIDARGHRPYGVLTLHRAGTVDDESSLREILEAVMRIAEAMPIVFPVHPRTQAKINSFGLRDRLRLCSAAQNEDSVSSGILAIEPLGYLDFLRLMSKARVVLTDSGGIQEETTILGVPCVTLRDSTERPVTVLLGTNVIGGTKRDDIITHTDMQLKRGVQKGVPGGDRDRLQAPPLWDGKAAERIVDILIRNKENTL